MRLYEMFDQDSRVSPEDDNSRLKWSDTRKTRLTLLQINKLRLMRELRAVEKSQKVDKIRTQYAQPAAQPM